MGNKTVAFVCILKTGKLYEHDMAANALQEILFPFIKKVNPQAACVLLCLFNHQWAQENFTLS